MATDHARKISDSRQISGLDLSHPSVENSSTLREGIHQGGQRVQTVLYTHSKESETDALKSVFDFSGIQETSYWSLTGWG